MSWRSGRHWAFGFAWVACVFWSPARATAEPSLWERAASPRSVRVERALNRIERVLDHVNQAEDDAKQDSLQRELGRRL